MVYWVKFICLLLLVIFCNDVNGQRGGFTVEPDTIAEDVPYIPPGEQQKVKMFAGKPGRAALYSMILPGAGQIYNGKWWKAPIVWGAVGTVGYFVVDNTRKYQEYRDAYHQRLITDMEGVAPIDDYPDFSADQIRVFRDRFNRFRQTSILVFGLTWIANAAEAFVDGHLKDFDISDDLSILLRPVMIDEYTSSLASGIVVRF